MRRELCFFASVLLLVAYFSPIVCPSGDMITSRRDRSYMDTSQLVSENLNNPMANKSNDYRSRKQQQPQYHGQSAAQQQRQQFIEPRNAAASSSNINDTILSIFHLGPEKGLRLFNTRLDPQPPPSPIIDHMQNDQPPFTDDPLNQEQAFKVQRTPDGKLNLVFNDFLFLQKANEGPSPTKRNDGIVFPDDHRLQPKAPTSWYEKPQCEEDNDGEFCTKVTNYPNLSGLRDTLLADLTKFQVFFGVDVAQPVNITQRMNTEPDEEFLCKSVDRVIFPQSGPTRDAASIFIVNNQIYKQGVHIEQCINEGGSCDSRATFPNNYQAICKQSYTYRSLVAIENGTIKQDQFKIPSCCKCVVKPRF